MPGRTDNKARLLQWELRASRAVLKVLQSGRFRNAWSPSELEAAILAEGVETTRRWIGEHIAQLMRFGVIECTRHSHTGLSAGFVRCDHLCLYRWRGLGSRVPFNPMAIETEVPREQ